MAKCHGKTSYDTAAVAGKALQSIRKSKDKRERTPCRHYECPVCGKHHLTSMPYTNEVPITLVHENEFRKFL